TTQEEMLTLSSDGIETLSVDTYNGKIILVADQAATGFSVKIEKKASARDEIEAQQCMEDILIVSHVDGSVQKLRWEWRDKEKARHNGWQAAVSFKVVLPPCMCTQCNTYNGKVELSGLIGDSKVVTYNGSIKMCDHKGDIHAETYNGNIDTSSLSSEIKMHSYNGDITSSLKPVSFLNGMIVTYNGRIKLDIDGEPSTRVLAKLSNGRIRASNEKIKVELHEKRKYSGIIGSGEGELNLETYNGNIDLD
ncbi:MAG: hypothetical protein ABIK28_09125, partial [Planctomycetota bacterium]